MSTGAIIKSKLFIQNTLFVAKNGDNATAERNRWDKPYATILEAKNNAVAGDTIYVFPGTYNEGSADITASDVQYFFEDGAIVQCNFEVISDFGLAKNIWVDGAGTFQTLGVNFGKGVVWTNNVGSTLYFRGKEIIGVTQGLQILNLDPTSFFDFHVDTIESLFQYPIFLRGNIQGTLGFNLMKCVDAVGIRLDSVNTDLVRRQIFINGGVVNSQTTTFNAGTLFSINAFNSEIHWNNITVNHTVGINGGIADFRSGFNYVNNLNGTSALGYGIVTFGTPVNRFVNCNIVSDRQGFRSVSNSKNEIVGGVISSSDDGASSNGYTVIIGNNSELDINGTTLEQTSADALPSIVRVQNNNLRMSNVKMVGSPTILDSIRSPLPQNIAVELQCTTNKPTDANLTNVVAGTNIIVDVNVGRNSQTIY